MRRKTNYLIPKYFQNFWYPVLSEISLTVCFSFSLPAPLNCADLLGNRGVGEGAEAEEPAVSKGGKVLPLFIILCVR